MLKVYKIAHNSKIYGPNIRDVIWFKGCSLHCKNCINQELWSIDNSNEFTVEELLNSIETKEVTFLGGEPLQQDDILPFVKALKRRKIGIILFTGYEQNELYGAKKIAADLCDVVIYGRYKDELKDDSLYLRGSLNQEIVFNTKRYNPNDFVRSNSYEVELNETIELRGRSKDFLLDLLEIKNI